MEILKCFICIKLCKYFEKHKFSSKLKSFLFITVIIIITIAIIIIILLVVIVITLIVMIIVIITVTYMFEYEHCRYYCCHHYHYSYYCPSLLFSSLFFGEALGGPLWRGFFVADTRAGKQPSPLLRPSASYGCGGPLWRSSGCQSSSTGAKVAFFGG